MKHRAGQGQLAARGNWAQYSIGCMQGGQSRMHAGRALKWWQTCHLHSTGKEKGDRANGAVGGSPGLYAWQAGRQAGRQGSEGQGQGQGR